MRGFIRHSASQPRYAELIKPRRRLLQRVALWTAAVALLVPALLILAIFVRLEIVAHRPSPARMTVTAAEIQAEDEHMKRLGLVVRDGAFLKEHPFEPPWTSHSLLTPSTWKRPPIMRWLGPRHVRADLLLADLDVLEPVMQRAYGGWDTASARGWNWDDWFARWRRHLAARGAAEISFDEAFSPVDALIAFQRDNHTQIPLARLSTVVPSQTSVLAKVPRGACTEFRAGGRVFPIDASDPGQRVRTAKLWRTGAAEFAGTAYLSMPSSTGTPDAVHCGDAWIPLQPAGEPPRDVLWSALLDELFRRDQVRMQRLGEGIVYARLPTFEPPYYEHASRAGWPRRRPDDRVLIVDLRGNGGGIVGYGLHALRGWIDQNQMVSFDQIGKSIVSSCLYPALSWNSGLGYSSQDWLDGIAHPYPPGCPRTVETTPPRWTYLQHRFQPKPGNLRILAVVNSGCASDCELMLEMLASLPATLIVGSNTFGMSQFIQPGYSILPHTGLEYSIALGTSNIYGDNRSLDGYGLDVDVVLPEVDSLKPEQLRELAKVVAGQQ